MARKPKDHFRTVKYRVAAISEAKDGRLLVSATLAEDYRAESPRMDALEYFPETVNFFAPAGNVRIGDSCALAIGLNIV